MSDENMSDGAREEEVLGKHESESANEWLVEFMQRTLDEGRGEVKRLQGRLGTTYQIIIGLSILMFFVGIGLIIAAAVKAFTDDEKIWQSFTIGGLGLADLTGLYLFRPIEQIRKIMADMSQLTVSINSYQTQVSLRLLETDSTDRATMGLAAEYIRKSVRDSLKNIQMFFEEDGKKGRDEKEGEGANKE